MFYDTESETLTKEDPRLDPLGKEWASFERERLPDDGPTFAGFRHIVTGETRNSDPRLTIEALRRRGAKIEEFDFLLVSCLSIAMVLDGCSQIINYK